MKRNTFAIPVGGRTNLKPSDIVWLEAEINYTAIYLKSGKKMVVSYNLGRLQERLKETGLFVRPNRKHLLNMNYIKSLEGNDLSLKSNSNKIKISRRRKENSINEIMAFNPKISKL